MGMAIYPVRFERVANLWDEGARYSRVGIDGCTFFILMGWQDGCYVIYTPHILKKALLDRAGMRMACYAFSFGPT